MTNLKIDHRSKFREHKIFSLNYKADKVTVTEAKCCIWVIIKSSGSYLKVVLVVSPDWAIALLISRMYETQCMQVEHK